MGSCRRTATAKPTMVQDPGRREREGLRLRRSTRATAARLDPRVNSRRARRWRPRVIIKYPTTSSARICPARTAAELALKVCWCGCVAVVFAVASPWEKRAQTREKCNTHTRGTNFRLLTENQGATFRCPEGRTYVHTYRTKRHTIGVGGIICF